MAPKKVHLDSEDSFIADDDSDDQGDADYDSEDDIKTHVRECVVCMSSI